MPGSELYGGLFASLIEATKNEQIQWGVRHTDYYFFSDEATEYAVYWYTDEDLEEGVGFSVRDKNSSVTVNATYTEGDTDYQLALSLLNSAKESVLNLKSRLSNLLQKLKDGKKLRQ